MGGVAHLWDQSYYMSRLLLDLHFVVQASLETWPEGARILKPWTFSNRRLHVFDVGCGSALIATSASRLGHRVTSADIPASTMEIAKANHRRNGIDVDERRFIQWDMFSAVPESLSSQGPWDFAVV